jgi:hypothetical protein
MVGGHTLPTMAFPGRPLIYLGGLRATDDSRRAAIIASCQTSNQYKHLEGLPAHDFVGCVSVALAIIRR